MPRDIKEIVAVRLSNPKDKQTPSVRFRMDQKESSRDYDIWNSYFIPDLHIILPHEIGLGNNPYDFTWIGFEYYQYAEPIIPIIVV